MLLAEREWMLPRIVDEFGRICRRRKMKVNTGKSKVMLFENKMKKRSSVLCEGITLIQPWREQ